MKILIIQENGRHDANRVFRECFCLQRAFKKLNIESTVWGLNHTNYNNTIDFNVFDLIINLENYGGWWEPDLSDINSKKFLWSIDAHMRGEQPFLDEFKKGKYHILLHSTKDYVDENYKIWFPNAFDDELIFPKNMEKKYDLGFCGSLLNRKTFIDKLSKRYNFFHHNFVLGNEMVDTINSYKIHWNRNISNDINYRSFETIGCSIPLVTNYNYQYELLGFRHGLNVMMYNNDEEMYESIDLLLNNEELRNSISTSGFELSKQHTYVNRVKKILNIFKDLN